MQCPTSHSRHIRRRPESRRHVGAPCRRCLALGRSLSSGAPSAGRRKSNRRCVAHAASPMSRARGPAGANKACHHTAAEAAILAAMFSALRALFHRQPPASPARSAQPARQLAAERTSEFFAWFHLEGDGTPVPRGDDLSHRFRPAGDSFRSVVALDVVTDAADGIRSACLYLDRSFLSGPEDAFARDIAKSFLGWILDKTAQEGAQPLIAHIADFAAANAPVIAAEPAAAAGGSERRLCRLHRRRRRGEPRSRLRKADAHQCRRAAFNRSGAGGVTRVPGAVRCAVPHCRPGTYEPHGPRICAAPFTRCSASGNGFAPSRPCS